MHEKYLPDRCTLEGLPVVAFEELEDLYDPADYHLFAPMTGRKMNRLREAVYHEAKAKGYRLISYVSSKATLAPNVQVGENCFILESATIEPFTTVGDNVMVWGGSHIAHHGAVNDHVFFAPRVCLAGHCFVESNCWLGTNSTVRDHTHLGRGTLLAMGACLTRQQTEPWSVYVGVPAKRAAMSSQSYDF